MHIKEHPILGEQLNKPITIYLNEQPLEAYENQSIAGALMANDVKKLGQSRKLVQARGMFCSKGRCCSCYMTVDGEDHVKTCMRKVRDGMKISEGLEDPELRRDIDEG
ncbi:(2Fe-2S)-binding protein [Cytobacillus sp. FSL W7-1323]|uniref:(2Fe-2S)-binding protein n=1 Tax=unclassified Cytobacillus TaxID=2675268 RepID=UPI0030FC2578